MEPIGTPSAAEISEAIIVWTAWGREIRPARDELQLVAQFGDEKARDLLPLLRRLEDEFYESDARFTVADLAEMGDKAAARFRQLHPELTQDSIEAFAWCYSYDFK
ncbi:MAG: hypothetical protein ACR2LQ_05010 [Acidimicrobiales bacterium]